MRTRCCFSFLVAGLGLAACSFQTSPTVPNDEVAAQKARRLCNETYVAVTRAADACCTDADRSSDLYETAKLVYGEIQCIPEDAAREHRIELNDAAIDGCIADYRAAIAGTSLCGRAITRFQVTSASCAAAVVGTREEGKECAHSYECRAGLACILGAGTSRKTCGASTDCRATGCGPTLYCNQSSLACTPRVTAGNACAALTGCSNGGMEACSNFDPCAAGLACDDKTTHTCVLQKAVGEACRDLGPKNDCASKLACIDGVCSLGSVADVACTDTFSSNDCLGRCTRDRKCVAFCGAGG